MRNSSQAPVFVLEAFLDVGLLKYLVFAVIMSVYVVTLCCNVLLILVICVNRALHQPMYLFLVSLFVNELYGSSGLFPLLLVHILSESHAVPAPLCFLQIFVIYTYANVEFCSLALMSYDRYLAICRPLQYRRLMAPCRMAVLVALSWLYPAATIAVLIALSASLRRCGNVIPKVYCDNYSVVKLACAGTTANNVYGAGCTAATAGLVLSIVFSYARILQVCLSGSRRTRRKAAGTCGPHLASLLNFSCGCFFEIAQSRFDMRHVSTAGRVVLSLYWLTCQPLLNPALYGLNLTKVRVFCRTLVLHKMSHG